MSFRQRSKHAKQAVQHTQTLTTEKTRPLQGKQQAERLHPTNTLSNEQMETVTYFAIDPPQTFWCAGHFIVYAGRTTHLSPSPFT